MVFDSHITTDCCYYSLSSGGMQGVWKNLPFAIPLVTLQPGNVLTKKKREELVWLPSFALFCDIQFFEFLVHALLYKT